MAHETDNLGCPTHQRFGESLVTEAQINLLTHIYYNFKIVQLIIK